jgi:acyl-CoA reductase-like NAD-dependent aldehyde dehydrogenase
MQKHSIYINGNWVESGQWLPVVNPADGEVFTEVTAVDREKVAGALAYAQASLDRC